jgi:hypothetical protein
MSNDYTSQMLQWIMDQSQAGQPMQFGPYEGKPSGLTAEMARRMNLGQDWLSVQADPSNAALAGQGAYSPEAFQPTTSYTPVDQPGTRELTALAQRLDTPLGMIAAGILRGSTASAEIAKLQQMYNEAEADGSLATDPLLSQIPGKLDNIDGTTMVPDWEGLSMRMNDVESSYMQEAQGAGSTAMYDPTTGEYLGGGNQQTVLDANGNPVLVDVETTPSEQAQWYAEQGLSPPDQQYQAPDLMDPGLAQNWNAVQPANDAFLNAMYEWGQMNQPTPPPDYKATIGGAAPTYGKGVEAVGGGGGGGGGGGNGEPVVNAGAGPAWWESLGIPQPQQDVGDIVNQIRAEQTRFGYPGMDQNMQAIIDAAAAQGNDVTDIINPANAGLGGATGASATTTAAPATANLPQHIQDLIAQATRPAPNDLVAAAAAQGNDVSDLNVGGYGGGFGGGTGGGYGFQGADVASLMKPSLMLGMAPMGGVPPQPPTGGSGAITTPADNGGMGPNGTQPPPAPLPTPSDANTLAMLRQLMGQQALDNFENQRQQQFNQPAPQASRTGPEPSESVPQAPTPQQTLGILGQQPAGALGSPDWQQLLNQSLQSSGQNLLPPSENERNQILGQTPGQPQGGGVLGIGDYLQQYVLGGGTQPHAGAPPQPPYNPLPGNQPAPTVSGGVNPSENAPTGASGPLAIGPSAPGYSPISRSWWQENMGTQAPTKSGGGQKKQPQQRSWWQENMTPSWWQGAMGGGRGTGDWPPSRSSDQQVRISGGTPWTSYKPPVEDTPERRRGRETTNAAWQRTRQAQRAAGIGTGDYGRAAAVAYLLQQQGITPATTQLAARRASATQLGM